MLAAFTTFAHFSVSSAVELAELLRRHRDRHAAELGERSFIFGSASAALNALFSICDDLGRRALGAATP